MTPPAIAPAFECREVLRFPAAIGATLDDDDEVAAGVGDRKVSVSAGVDIRLCDLDAPEIDAMDVETEGELVGAAASPPVVVPTAVGAAAAVESDLPETSSVDDGR